MLRLDVGYDGATHLSCDVHIWSTIIGRTLPLQEVFSYFSLKKNLSPTFFLSWGRRGGLQVCEGGSKRRYCSWACSYFQLTSVGGRTRSCLSLSALIVRLDCFSGNSCYLDYFRRP